MVSVCLPSDGLLQHLPSYLGFSYLGRGVSLHGCSSKTQPLFLISDEGYLLTVALPDLQSGIAPLGPPALAQPHSLDVGLLLPAAAAGLGHGIAPSCRRPCPWVPPLASGVGLLLLATAPGLGHGVAPPSRCPGLVCRVAPPDRRP